MLKIENIQRLDLGIQGENGSRPIEIDCSLWRDLYPDGQISIHHKRPGDTVQEVTTSTYDADTAILRWTPTSYDTYYHGTGTAEIRVTENQIIKKAVPVETTIHPALTADGSTIQSNQQAYIDAIEALKNAAAASAEDAEDMAGQAEASAEAAETAAGIAIAQGGKLKFEVNSAGHLIMSYTDEVPIDEDT